VQNEGIDVSAQFGDHEGHPMGHEPADEMHIAAEAVQLGDGYVALELLRSCESGLELGRRSRASEPFLFLLQRTRREPRNLQS
jgi:hypothetical protein